MKKTHGHTHHHHGPDVHHDRKDSEHHSHDAMDRKHHEHLGAGVFYRHGEDTDATHDDHPHDSSHPPLPRTEPEPDSASGTEAPLFYGTRSTVAEQALLSDSTDDGDDINDGDGIGADISVVAAMLQKQLRPEPDEPPQLHTRRRAGQLAVMKVLQQRRTDLDATQLERQRHDFERRSTPDPEHPQPPTLSRVDS